MPKKQKENDSSRPQPGEINRDALNFNIPANLLEWRNVSILAGARLLWNQFEPFFRSQGYSLFTGKGSTREGGRLKLPEGLSLRSAPDGSYAFDRLRHEAFLQPTSLHCWARNSCNQDVVIKLVAWREEGNNELEILRKIASGVKAFHPANHALYVNHELQSEDRVFCVFPRMKDEVLDDNIWFYNVAEMFEFLGQIIEGFRYLHDNLIAHRDIGFDNMLYNFSGQTEPPWFDIKMEDLKPFRSSFRIRYYIIDFELSAMFSSDSDPKDRLVKGIPCIPRGTIHPEEYGRDLPPEALLEEPYCPFKADVFQLGALFVETFEHIYDIIPKFSPLFSSMKDDDAQKRPDMPSVESHFKAIRGAATKQLLSTRVPIAPEKPYVDAVEDYKQRQERKAIRLAALAAKIEAMAVV